MKLPNDTTKIRRFVESRGALPHETTDLVSVIAPTLARSARYLRSKSVSHIGEDWKQIACLPEESKDQVLADPARSHSEKLKGAGHVNSYSMGYSPPDDDDTAPSRLGIRSG